MSERLTDSSQTATALTEKEASNAINDDIEQALAEMESSADEESKDEKPAKAQEDKPAEAEEEQDDGAEPEEASDDGDEKESGEEEETASDGEEETALEAPGDFNTEEREAFAKLDHNAKSLVAKYAKRSQTSRAKVANELETLKRDSGVVTDTLKQYQPYFQQIGVTPDQAVAQVMPFYAYLTLGTPEQKTQAYKLLGERFNVKPPAPQETDVYQDDYSPSDPRIDKLTETVTTLQQSLQQQQMSAAQAQEEALRSEVTQFAEAKDDSGQPLHPHFDNVRLIMGSLMQADPSMSLKDAYDRAVFAHPETRAAVLSEREKANKAKEERKINEAKKAAKVNKKVSSAPASKPKMPKKLDDEVSDAFDELYPNFGA